MVFSVVLYRCSRKCYIGLLPFGGILVARNRTFTFQPTRELNDAYDKGFDLDVAGFHTSRPVFEDKTHAFVDILVEHSGQIISVELDVESLYDMHMIRRAIRVARKEGLERSEMIERIGFRGENFVTFKEF